MTDLRTTGAGGTDERGAGARDADERGTGTRGVTAARSPRRPESEALYVYALLPERPGVPHDVTGLDGRPTRLLTVPGTGIAALVHDAPAAPYEGGDDQVRRWVSEQSEAVVTVWDRTGSVLPMTFNVLVAGAPNGEQTAEQRLTEWIASRAPELTGHLEALQGRCELRVEITMDRAAAAAGDPRAQALQDQLAGRSAGLRRLLTKQLDQIRRETAERLADTLHADLRRRLLSVAEDLRDRRRSRRDPGEADVLSAALLVRREDIDAVGTILSDLQARHPAARVHFLGPWPPYSFVELPTALPN